MSTVLPCTFNGGCGQLFFHQSDLLDHVSGHLDQFYLPDEGTAENAKDKLLHEDKGVWDLAGCDVTTNFLDDCVSPRKLFSYELESQQLLLPELDESEETSCRMGIEEMCPPSTAIDMDLILQPANPCLELVSSEPLTVLDNVNWGELLQNYPSVTDDVKYKNDSNSFSGSDSQDSYEKPQDAHDPSSLTPGTILLHDDYRSGAEGGSNDEFQGPLHHAPSSQNHGRTFEVIQREHLYSLHDLPSEGQDLKLSRGKHQPPCFKSNTCHVSSYPFNQEMVTFVTEEKRTYNGIVTTPTPSAKKKQVNRRRTQHQRQVVKHYSSEFILKEGLKKKYRKSHPLTMPYVCPVPGCGKAYKNPNGIKYHARYGHSARQEFPCSTCGNIYSTRPGLMAHRRSHSTSSSDSIDVYSFSEREESDDYQNQSF